VLVSDLVAVVLLDDLVEERSEGVVRVVGTGIDTDARVVHLEPEKMHCWKVKPNLSLLSLQASQTSGVRHFWRRDWVPAGKKGREVMSEGDLRWLPIRVPLAPASAVFMLEV